MYRARIRQWFGARHVPRRTSQTTCRLPLTGGVLFKTRSCARRSPFDLPRMPVVGAGLRVTVGGVTEAGASAVALSNSRKQHRLVCRKSSAASSQDRGRPRGQSVEPYRRQFSRKSSATNSTARPRPGRHPCPGLMYGVSAKPAGSVPARGLPRMARGGKPRRRPVPFSTCSPCLASCTNCALEPARQALFHRHYPRKRLRHGNGE